MATFFVCNRWIATFKHKFLGRKNPLNSMRKKTLIALRPYILSVLFVDCNKTRLFMRSRVYLHFSQRSTWNVRMVWNFEKNSYSRFTFDDGYFLFSFRYQTILCAELYKLEKNSIRSIVGAINIGFNWLIGFSNGINEKFDKISEKKELRLIKSNILCDHVHFNWHIH